MKIRKQDFFNLPNLLCYFRIMLIPIFLFFYIDASTSKDYLMSAFILILSGTSDFFDGYIARKYHMVTDWGKVIDPIADKLTQATVALVLLWSYRWMWVLLLIIFIKDAMLGFVGLFIYESSKIIKGASWWGKIATAFFDIAVVILIAFHVPDNLFANILIFISILFMALSFILYAKQLYSIARTGSY